MICICNTLCPCPQGVTSHDEFFYANDRGFYTVHDYFSYDSYSQGIYQHTSLSFNKQQLHPNLPHRLTPLHNVWYSSSKHHWLRANSLLFDMIPGVYSGLVVTIQKVSSSLFLFLSFVSYVFSSCLIYCAKPRNGRKDIFFIRSGVKKQCSMKFNKLHPDIQINFRISGYYLDNYPFIRIWRIFDIRMNGSKL